MRDLRPSGEYECNPVNFLSKNPPKLKDTVKIDIGPLSVIQQKVNVRVWLQGRDYVESAEILMDYNRLQPAVVMASLASEIFLKSLFATRYKSGRATTDRGHSIVEMFNRLDPKLQAVLLHCSEEIDPSINLLVELQKHDKLFVSARYWYEPTTPNSVGSDSVYFARHLCETVFLLGKKLDS
jgi:HEPN domain-containing protein